jgi:peptidoglycan hydrolase-like protein with peptidoglycan-binding domain
MLATGVLLVAVGIAAAAIWGWPIEPDKTSLAANPEPTRVEAAALSVRADLPATPVALPPVAAPAPPPDPAPAVVAGPIPVPVAAPAVQPASKDKAGPLAWDEARELQSRLKAAGFDPGPIDGIVGLRTTEAARRYGEARTLRASDPSKDMLVRLRGEPTQSAELSR